MVLENVIVRVDPSFVLEAHLDMDEANCADLKNGDPAFIIRGAFQDTPVRTVQPAAPAAGEAPKAEPAAPRRTAVTLVTEDIVKAAARTGESIYAAKGAVITPLAKDAIRELGVEIERE